MSATGGALGNEPAGMIPAQQNGTMPAYPVAETQQDGLTKRELIAAMVLQGFASVPLMGMAPGVAVRADVERAVDYADTLLAELAKEPQA